MSLIGATIITFFSGPVSDSVGRRPMLILSSIFYFFSGLVMLWSPNVYVLLLARLIDGFGIGLAVTLVPLYISEISPPEIRGLLNTFPQFTGSVGMFASYIMVFFMSLLPRPDWRFMLSVLSIPSLVYMFLTVFYLPESPRWLVSKGRMNEANKVLQKLRGTDDVSGEMALLFEGLGVGGQTSIEEYMVGPVDDKIGEGDESEENQLTLGELKKGVSWIARPNIPRNESIEIQKSVPFMDPLVTLFGSVHEKSSEMGGGSTLFPNFGSMSSVLDQHQQQPPKKDHWGVENNEIDEYTSQCDGNYSDENDDEKQQLRSPLLSREATGMELKESCSVVIGGGWQLAWKKVEDGEGFKDGFKRIYLHPENEAAENEFIPAAALVTQSTHFAIHPTEEGSKSNTQWRDLLEPGVRRALVVGVTLQILQQFAGINGVLYYTPQILSQAGVEVLFSNLGISSDSASFLISGITTFLMLPSIGVAMWLMDKSGRRSLLLCTIPVLICSLLLLVVSSAVHMDTVLQAVLSTVSVIMYFCCFVMGFGPIPNILCAEIFPTRVRGLCIAICALTFWTCDIIVTYSLPIMLNWIGLAGLFGLYAVVCCIALLFVYLKVPETKGMPLEVITDFFSVESPPENTNL